MRASWALRMWRRDSTSRAARGPPWPAGGVTLGSQLAALLLERRRAARARRSTTAAGAAPRTTSLSSSSRRRAMFASSSATCACSALGGGIAPRPRSSPSHAAPSGLAATSAGPFLAVDRARSGARGPAPRRRRGRVGGGPPPPASAGSTTSGTHAPAGVPACGAQVAHAANEGREVGERRLGMRRRRRGRPASRAGSGAARPAVARARPRRATARSPRSRTA